MVSTRRMLLRYLRPLWRRALALLALLLGGVGLQLAAPQIIRYFIDTARAGGSLRGLTIAAGLFLLVAVLNQIVGSAAGYLGQDVGWTVTNTLRNDLAAHCLGLDMSFHNRRTPGEMIERIDGDITALSTVFAQVVTTILGGALLLLGSLAMLYLADWRVGVALTLFVLAAVVVLTRGRRFAVPALRASRQASATLYGAIEERLAGLDDLRANGAGAYAVLRLHQYSRDFFNKDLHAENLRTVIWAATGGLFTIGTIIALAMGGYLYHQGAVTLGTVFLIFQYTEMLRAPLERITQQMQELQRAAAGLIRVRELFETHGTLAEDGRQPLPAGPLGVELEHVSFAYDDRMVLENLSFRLAPGRVLGLLGRTGSGKTTLIRLLFHLYEPTCGTVRVGGVDTRGADPAALRARIGLVTQDVQLFQATVRENLTLFDPAIPDDRILEALEQVGLGPWLRGLPAGLGSVLAADGGLSAGEAQLLALARVFLRDPGLVILDEPSSRLDLATEARIERAIDTLLAGRTGIIIAHRLATVARADEVVVLEDGALIEHGRRDRLADDPSSRFAALLRAGLHEVPA